MADEGAAQAEFTKKCDHICMREEGHDGIHIYGYENPSPRERDRDLFEARAELTTTLEAFNTLQQAYNALRSWADGAETDLETLSTTRASLADAAKEIESLKKHAVSNWEFTLLQDALSEAQAKITAAREWIAARQAPGPSPSFMDLLAILEGESR